MRPTIRDVAQKAGVSPATVSLVLNNRQGVGPETRRLVHQAAEELGYQLQRKQSPEPSNGSICFLKIVCHGHILNRDHNEFISEYIEGIGQETRKQHMTLEVRSYSSLHAEEIITDLQEARYRGLIVLATEMTDEEMSLFTRFHFPVVFIDASSPHLPFDFIDMDNEGALYHIVSTLKGLGHTDIGIVTATHTTRNFLTRERCFREAMEHHGLAVREDRILTADSTLAQAREDLLPQLKTLGEDLPSALFCVCDIIAYGVLNALKELGRTVPDECSVIGFDDLLSSQVTDPPLASVEVSKMSIGSKAAGLLLRRLEHKEVLPYEKVYIGSRLIARESLGRKGEHNT